ncbi:GNAT family N-acetyltransferase [Priestia endophytica]|uniref:GNAT family N-acetyltransferase n=1 Tax=Priestia endophytica TaxID=135735 RepID=UPI00227F7615|nr:GNAT family N-acetyltransferase [Priestia endophytica]MCY8235561.1 GNAT family N-acetyltransferase [Priestia endophytica]
MVQIREIKLEDAKGLIKHAESVLENSTFTLTTREEFQASEDSQKQWIKNMQKQGNLILIAENEGEIIGDLLFIRGKKKRNSHTGELAIGIQEPYRGKGIGRQLLQSLIIWAKGQESIKKLCLQVIEGNDPAIGLYKKVGFQEEGRLKNQVMFSKDKYADMINMSLFLDS